MDNWIVKYKVFGWINLCETIVPASNAVGAAALMGIHADTIESIERVQDLKDEPCDPGVVYRIKKDYPVNAVNRCNVYTEGVWVKYGSADERISKAIDIVNFMYYEYADGIKCTEPRRLAGDGVSGLALDPKYVVFKKE